MLDAFFNWKHLIFLQRVWAPKGQIYLHTIRNRKKWRTLIKSVNHLSNQLDQLRLKSPWKSNASPVNCTKNWTNIWISRKKNSRYQRLIAFRKFRGRALAHPFPLTKAPFRTTKRSVCWTYLRLQSRRGSSIRWKQQKCPWRLRVIWTVSYLNSCRSNPSVSTFVSSATNGCR